MLELPVSTAEVVRTLNGSAGSVDVLLGAAELNSTASSFRESP